MKRLGIAAVGLALVVSGIVGSAVGNPFASAQPADALPFCWLGSHCVQQRPHYIGRVCSVTLRQLDEADARVRRREATLGEGFPVWVLVYQRDTMSRDSAVDLVTRRRGAGQGER